MAKTKAKTAEAAPGRNHSLTIGLCYFIRGVTMYYTGRLTAITETDLVLDDAAWIADTGRLATMLKEGPERINEVEPFSKPVIIQRASIVDITEWLHALPRTQK